MMKRQRRITKAYFDAACLQYVPLIQKLAFQIGTDDAQIDDMKACAKEELLKCMICYRRSGSFITFFHGRLAGRFRHMRDAEQRAKRVQVLSLEAMSHLAGPNRDADTHMMVEELMGCLNEEERAVITGLFFDEKTMREVSQDQGIVPSTVCRIKSMAIDKMRQKCETGKE
ncbi:MAG: hypothetical protein DRJ03_00135 [Chloroflexi bacterium]|nr:MAG: hypothetical protein DRJ03_00135 [Chloroflexota bacterium]